VKYALYLGCLIPARELSYELATRTVMPALDVELMDMEGTSCCGPFAIQSLDYTGWLALAARNLCIAEKMKLDIMALCNDCYESLMMVNETLKKDKETREKVNEILSVANKKFKGTVNVKHTMDVLVEDVGLDKIRSKVTKPLDGLRVATQVGCHLVRPKMLHAGEGRGFEVLDDLVRALGAEAVNYDDKEVCCGGPLRDIDDHLSRSLSNRKLSALKRANVDCVVTACPFCYIQFDLGQLEIKRLLKEEYNIPVLHFVELLSLAMGYKSETLQLREHRVPIDKIVKKLA
jgi:heterodisulfide reductase subunit B